MCWPDSITTFVFQVHIHRNLYIWVSCKNHCTWILYRRVYIPKRSMELAGFHGHFDGVSILLMTNLMFNDIKYVLKCCQCITQNRDRFWYFSVYICFSDVFFCLPDNPSLCSNTDLRLLWSSSLGIEVGLHSTLCGLPESTNSTVLFFPFPPSAI